MNIECPLQILGRVNESVVPCDDFWEFACGGWLQANPIPKTKSHWSTTAAEELHGESFEKFGKKIIFYKNFD